MNELTLRRPDDFHLHLRDGAALARTVADASRQCGRALVMPNLVRQFVGDNLRRTLPWTAWLGAVMTLACDILAFCQTLALARTPA